MQELLIVDNLHLLLQGASAHGILHHLLGDGEVLWQFAASLDHHGVEPTQVLVAKKLVLFPMLKHILYERESVFVFKMCTVITYS